MKSRESDILPFIFAAGLGQVGLGLTFFIAGGNLSPALYMHLLLQHFHLLAPLTVASGVALLAQVRGMRSPTWRAVARFLAAGPFLLLVLNFFQTGVPSGVIVYSLLAAGLIYAGAGGRPALPAGGNLLQVLLALFLTTLGVLQLVAPGAFPASAYPVPHAVGLPLFAVLTLLAGLLQAVRVIQPGRLPAAAASILGSGVLTGLALNFALVRVWTGVAVYASLLLTPALLRFGRNEGNARTRSAEAATSPIDYYYVELVTWFFVVFLTSIPLFTTEASNPAWRYLAGVTGVLAGFNVLWPEVGYKDPQRRAFVHLGFLSTSLSILMVTADELKALLYLSLSLIPIPLAGLVLGPQGVWLTGGISLFLSFVEVLRDSGWGTNFSTPSIGWHLASHGVTLAAMSAVAYIVSIRLVEYMRERNMVLADLKEMNRVLRDLATRDPLTGLYNHGFFQERLEQELNRASRSGGPLSLAMLDLDRFKQVNDTYGHQVGDEVLRLLANILRQNLRVSDVAARYGGEEIAVIFPDTDAAGAATVIERIRQLLESAAVDVGPGQKLTGITLSAGVATYPEAGLDRHSLIRAADDALYAAKAQGRNRICVAGPASSAGALAAPPGK